MRLNRITTLATFSMMFCLAFGGTAVAQGTAKSRFTRPANRSATRAAGPPTMDADPHFHRVLANSQVRVFRLSVAPNEATQLDAHPHDYIVVSLGLNNIEAVGEINTFPLQMGDGEAQVLTGGWSHKIVNHAPQPANLLILEVVRGISPQQAMCGLSGRSCGQVKFGNTLDGRYTQTILFETETVRLMRAELGPGGKLPNHADPSDHLVVTLTDALLSDGLNEAAEQPAGNTIWTPGSLGTVRNSGAQDARMLILELK